MEPIARSELCRGAVSRLGRRCRWTCTLILLLAGTGCQSYNWRSDFAAAEQQAREQSKYLFIFYKWWLDDASNRMLSNEVLSDPEVQQLFLETINVLLEKDSGPAYKQYVSKYGVTDPPAVVLVAPDGSYRVQRGFTPKGRFINFVKKARTTRPKKPGSRRRTTRQP